jgi:hypothetical protein
MPRAPLRAAEVSCDNVVALIFSECVIEASPIEINGSELQEEPRGVDDQCCSICVKWA